MFHIYINQHVLQRVSRHFNFTVEGKKNYGHSEFTKVCDHTQLMCDCSHDSKSSNVAALSDQRIYFAQGVYLCTILYIDDHEDCI